MWVNVQNLHHALAVKKTRFVIGRVKFFIAYVICTLSSIHLHLWQTSKNSAQSTEISCFFAIERFSVDYTLRLCVPRHVCLCLFAFSSAKQPTHDAAPFTCAVSKRTPSHLKGRDFTATGLNQREKGARTTGLTVTQLPLPLRAHLFDRTRFWRREYAGSIRLELFGAGEFQGELLWVSVETVKEQGKEDYNAKET